MGSERSGVAPIPVSPRHDGRQHILDTATWRRGSQPAAGRHGCCSENAATGKKLRLLAGWPAVSVVASGPRIIEILPVDPAFYYLPIYDPLIVFGRPRGLAAGITFGPRVAIGSAVGLESASPRMGFSHDPPRRSSVGAKSREPRNIRPSVCGATPCGRSACGTS